MKWQTSQDSQITVMKEGMPILSADMDSLYPNESYKGSENHIQEKRVH